ncbi:hypothetical protein TRIP_C60496 [Candidatus Zixiibacteriota bacterium]|nr:hypothetical protein TRIP_C60496 [candidate division Zixibacteria bacterium]
MARFFLSILIAIFVLALVSGCPKDTIVKPPSTLVGNYHGLITIIRGYDTSTPTTVQEWIDWTFSDYKFWMTAEKTDLLPKIFCDITGNYSLTDKITLSDTSMTDVFTCIHEDIPVGTFSIFREADSVKISGTMREGSRWVEIALKKE